MRDSSSNFVIQKDAGDEWLMALMKDEPGSDENGNSQHERAMIPMLSTDPQSVWSSFLVGIGPYSKGYPRKLDRLKTIMARQFVQDCGISIEVMYNKVAEVVLGSNSRKYYDEAKLPRDMNDEEFVNVLFLDGCFILQFIFSYLRKPENLKMITMGDIFLVKGDLLKLQNQLPFHVLQSLMSFRFKEGEGEGEGEELINDFIEDIRSLPPRDVSSMQRITNYIRLPRAQSKLIIRKQENGDDDQPAHHLLELFHRKLINGKYAMIDPAPRKRMIWYRNRSAKDLKNRGIHFRPSRTDVVTDVKFKSTLLGGILELPRITIEIISNGLLHNLMKYENDYDASKKLLATSYLLFLDSLIQDAEDVNILQSAGILINNLGRDQQVADLFNEMNRHMYCTPYTYNDVKWQIESHYRQITKRWLAEWLQAYFSNPWTFIAFVAATFVLILTAVQTYLAAFPPTNH